VDSYVDKIHQQLETSLRDAEAHSRKEADRQKRTYDRRAHAVTLKPGDQVLIRVGSVRGSHKLHDRWESVLYEVVRPVAAGVPAYIVRHPDTGAEQTQHRNRLYLVQPEGGTEVSARAVRSESCVIEYDQRSDPARPGENVIDPAPEHSPVEDQRKDVSGRAEKSEVVTSGDTSTDADKTLLCRMLELVNIASPSVLAQASTNDQG
jgi:hypothetical protein